MDIIVRFAKKDDLEMVNVYRKQVNDLHVAGRPDVFKAGFCTEMQEFVYKQFESNTSDIIVAEYDGDIVGFATVNHIVKPSSPYSCERKIYQISEFGVDENHQRKGIATLIMNFIKTDAKNKGFSNVELDVYEFNKKAIEFYKTVGFTTYRRYLELNI